MNTYKFWKTQPIDISKNLCENKPVIDIDINTIKKEPIILQEPFQWCDLDISNETELDLVYNFLLTYYCDDINDERRFHYSKETLKWFLMPYNYYKDLLVGVKVNGKLVATIFGIPMTVKIYDKVIKIIEINFLCIHQSIRNKRLTPILIKEITRRTNLHGIFQAFYTASPQLPNVLMNCLYYHRPLNVPKLVDIDFMTKPPKISIQGYSRLFKIIEKPTINIRPIKETDFIIACQMLNEYHKKFNISILFEQEDFNHHFLFRKNVIESYVVETNGIISDFISFFFIPSKLLTNKKYSEITRGFLYYYFNTKTDLDKLVENGLYFMKENGIDVVNCVKQYNNEQFINKLKFMEGTGGLNFYFFNWICPPIKYSDMAIIMI
jgi:glycylpeptide N-tetradecanoyltransferase